MAGDFGCREESVVNDSEDNIVDAARCGCEWK